MEKAVIKTTKTKGNGLFAAKNIKQGELLFKIDLSKLKSRSIEQISKMQDNNHADYVGHGKYVISHHLYSYMNHSCDPNVLIKHKSIAKSEGVAMRNIDKGEELTIDYGVNAMDQFGKTLWTLDCKCKSENCRKRIPGDFFKQPLDIQRKYFKNLPPSIKRKFKGKIKKLS